MSSPDSQRLARALVHEWIVYRTVSGAPKGWRCGSCDASTDMPDDALCPGRVALALDAAHNDLPRHLRLAIANATRAFERDDLGALATINETIQPLVDAAIAYGRRRQDAALPPGTPTPRRWAQDWRLILWTNRPS